MNKSLSLPPVAGRIDVEQVAIRLGHANASFEAVQDISFAVPPGTFTCLLGPSGCGKSTLLGALAGHIAPSHGRLTIDGQAVGGPDPDRGIVFQHHTLFPWKTVLENVAFGPKMKGIAKAERHHQAGKC